MKKLLIMIALVAGVATLSKAQGGGPQGTPEERAKASLERQSMAAYNFTADQKAKLTVILTRQNKSQDSLRTIVMAGGADPQTAYPAMAAKLAPISAANEAAAVALLTADQKKTYDAALATAKQNNPNATTVLVGGRGRRPQQ